MASTPPRTSVSAPRPRVYSAGHYFSATQSTAERKCRFPGAAGALPAYRLTIAGWQAATCGYFVQRGTGW